jgi:hypothetical protein
MPELEEALWQAFDGSLVVSDVSKHAEHDQGEEINIGYQTDDGAKLAEAYQSSLIDEPS